MNVLGIESTAHTFGIGIVNEEEVLVNIKDMFEPEEGGIHPRKAAEHHRKKALNLINEAENKSIKISEIDAIAYSQGPGIPQCLDIGAVTARTLAKKYEIPLIGVNHCISHISIGKRTTEATNPTTLYVSGGNSQIIQKNSGKYRVIGETQDIALGNALDKLARKLNYPYPGGPEIENQAQKTEEIVELSYPIKGMDFSFSGLVTEAQRQKEEIEEPILCNSFQEHAYSAVVEALERAMSQNNSKEALLTGGVAMNKRLREMVKKMCEQRNAKAYFPPDEYCMDNGAMIAHQGLKKYNKNQKITKISKSAVKPNWRPDQVEL